MYEHKFIYVIVYLGSFSKKSFDIVKIIINHFWLNHIPIVSKVIKISQQPLFLYCCNILSYQCDYTRFKNQYLSDEVSLFSKNADYLL